MLRLAGLNASLGLRGWLLQTAGCAIFRAARNVPIASLDGFGAGAKQRLPQVRGWPQPRRQFASGSQPPPSVVRRAEDLRNLIKACNQRYYNDQSDPSSGPLLSDQEYDNLLYELQSLERQFPRLASEDSPSQSVGAPLRSGARAVRHRTPMHSLQNISTRAELRNFLDGLLRATATDSSPPRICVEVKYDGIAVSLTYAQGVLIGAATRGDGKVGEDILANIRQLLAPDDLPQRLDGGDRLVQAGLATAAEAAELGRALREQVVEVRGEVVLSKAGLARLRGSLPLRQDASGVDGGIEDGSHAPPAAGEDQSSRNVCAGLLRREDPGSEVAGLLNLVAYTLEFPEIDGRGPREGGAEGEGLDSQFRRLQLLRALGFRTDTQARLVQAPMQGSAGLSSLEHQISQLHAEWLDSEASAAGDVDNGDAHLDDVPDRGEPPPLLGSPMSPLPSRTSLRTHFPYEADGLVLKLDQIGRQRRLGATARAPRWAAAFKFPPRSAWTTLEGVHLQIGRTGRATPVADLTPMRLAGVRVTRASLYNHGRVQALRLRPGLQVMIERRGDVIPAVTQARPPLFSDDSAETAPSVDHEGLMEQLRVCPCPNRVRLEPRVTLAAPAAEAAALLGADGAPSAALGEMYCTYEACPHQRQGRLVYLAGRSALDLPGLGPATVRQLGEMGLLVEPLDLLALPDRLPELLERQPPPPGWGPRRVARLVNGLRLRLGQLRPLDVLTGLGIPHCGPGVCRSLLASVDGALPRLLELSLAEIAAIEGVGPVRAEAIREALQAERNLLLRFSEILGSQDHHQQQDQQHRQQSKPSLPVGRPLEGQRVVLTGRLAIPRAEARRCVEALGGQWQETVGLRTTLLVVGSSDEPGAAAGPSKKLRRAQELGVRLVGEAEFLQLIGSTGESGPPPEEGASSRL